MNDHPAAAPPSVADPALSRLLRIAEFAGLLGVSLRKAISLLGTGEIPVVRLGPRCRRVRLADALAFIAARRS